VIQAMLAQTREPSVVSTLTWADTWCMQQKCDGVRVLPHLENGKVTCYSRKGLPMQVAPSVTSALKVFSRGTWVFDGEYLNDELWLFDLVVADEIITPRTPYCDRRGTLVRLIDHLGIDEGIKVLPSVTGIEGKQELLRRLTEHKAEGYMLRSLSSPYLPGKRSKDLVKVKWNKDIDCVVTRLYVGGHNNFAVAVYDGDRLVEIGEVTRLSADGDKVKPGDVVTVKILYVTNDNRLYQPTLPRLRSDKDPEECTIDQLENCRTTKAVLA